MTLKDKYEKRIAELEKEKAAKAYCVERLGKWRNKAIEQSERIEELEEQIEMLMTQCVEWRDKAEEAGFRIAELECEFLDQEKLIEDNQEQLKRIAELEDENKQLKSERYGMSYCRQAERIAELEEFIQIFLNHPYGQDWLPLVNRGRSLLGFEAKREKLLNDSPGSTQST